MRVVNIYFSILFLLFCCAGCVAEQPQKPDTTDAVSIAPTHAVYAVQFSEFQMQNNSVGRDWNIVYSCDGKQIESGKQWVVPLHTTKSVTVDIAITEQDEWDDIGTGSLSLTLQDGFCATTTITVTENKGRFWGNQAKWKVTGSVSLVNHLGSDHS